MNEDPGTSVGIICSQSLSQPITQIALSSFHHAGDKNELIKQGVPRVEALIDQTIKLSESSNSFFYNHASWHEHVKLVDFTIGDLIVEHFLMDSVTPSQWSSESWWYRVGVSSGFYPIDPLSLCEHNDATGILRLRFDKEKMERYQLSLFDLLKIIKKQITGDEVFFFPSPQSEGIIDMIMCRSNAEKSLLKILIKIISPTQIFDSSVDGIKDIRLAQGTIITKGANTFGLLQSNNEVIDKKTLRTDHPRDMLNALGVEAARKVLVEELGKAMFGEIRYNDKHINLLADFMTSKGGVSSIKSISNLLDDKSVLTRAANERSIPLLKEACIKSVSSEVIGVAESIITGQRAHMGTGFFSIE